MSKSPAKPRNAFDMMKANAAKAKASTSAPAPVVEAGGYVPPVFTKSTFKGSGLGAGPRHVLDVKDQPWVEK